MTMQSELTIRPLVAGDFDSVVALDAALVGRSRPGFFEKRLAAAVAAPRHFVYIGCAAAGGTLRGFLLARLHEGEYGAREPVAVLDVIGVDPQHQGQGVGQAMLEEMDRIIGKRQAVEVQTQADWRNAGMLRFLAANAFTLAHRYVLARRVDYLPSEPPAEPPEDDPLEPDYSAPAARPIVHCRTLEHTDLERLVAIDRKLMGTARPGYFERKVEEVLEETGIRVSQVAELDGMVVGFIMARVDYGEFDRTELTAVIDTIGVDPDFAQHRAGRALLRQLLGNLATLRLERVQTQVGSEHFDVLGFLMHSGFVQSQTLAFSRRP